MSGPPTARLGPAGLVNVELAFSYVPGRSGVSVGAERNTRWAVVLEPGIDSVRPLPEQLTVNAAVDGVKRRPTTWPPGLGSYQRLRYVGCSDQTPSVVATD